jgi:hypothetical protein
MFSYTYQYDYAGGVCTRVYADLWVRGVLADCLGSGASEEEARAAALARWHRVPFDVLEVTGG